MQLKTKKSFSLEIDDEESKVLINEINKVNFGEAGLEETTMLMTFHNLLKDSLL